MVINAITRINIGIAWREYIIKINVINDKKYKIVNDY